MLSFDCEYDSEKDLGEVMQIDNVFLNVSKGQAANKDDLMKCFKTEDRNAIILEVHITHRILLPIGNDTSM